MEIERKFLVRDVPAGFSDAAVRLRQGYVATGPDAEVRVRDAGGVATLTVKSGAGMVRAETEVALSAEQFARLWPATQGRRIEKLRAQVPVGTASAEVDVYEGDLAGLAVVEVEFDSVSDASAFEPPDWFGREVTEDPAYKNASLALKGRPAD